MQPQNEMKDRLGGKRLNGYSLCLMMMVSEYLQARLKP